MGRCAAHAPGITGKCTPAVRRLIGLCWALFPLIAATGCRSAGVAFPDASDVTSPADGTGDQSIADASSDSAFGDGTVAEKRCGDDPNVYFGAYTVDDLAKVSGCTVLVGRFQEDSLRDLVDLAALRNVRRIEGFLEHLSKFGVRGAARLREPGGGSRRSLHPPQ